MGIESETLLSTSSTNSRDRKTLRGIRGGIAAGFIAINGIGALTTGAASDNTSDFSPHLTGTTGTIPAEESIHEPKIMIDAAPDLMSKPEISVSPYDSNLAEQVTTEIMTDTPHFFEPLSSPIGEFHINSFSNLEIIPIRESVRESKVLLDVRAALGSEPTISVSPFGSNLLAVSYQHVKYSGCDLSGVRISKDGGKTWKVTEQQPWKGSCPDFHGQVAWGPGPKPGSSRLWWADAMLLGSHNVSPGIAYSDDLGKTWKLYIEKRTPPWVGGFPDITVDNNKTSPNFGAVYVAYNWLESSNGPGLSVIASGDNGKSWQIVQVPHVQLKGFPDWWRIGYRLKTAPDGSVIVSFYQSNMKYWSKNDIFNQGGPDNIGRLGFATAQLHFDPKTKKLTADKPVWAISLSSKNTKPQWQTGLDIDQSSGRVFMSVADSAKNGIIRVGHSDDKGKSWNWKTLGVSGESNRKPSIASQDGVVFVGFHGLDKKGTVGTYFTVSYDNGKTFSTPKLVTKNRYKQAWINGVVNGTGLRENVTFGPNGYIYYAYGVALPGGKVETRVAVIIP